MPAQRHHAPTFLLLATLLVVGEVLLVVSPWASALADLDVPVIPPGFRTPGQQQARDAVAQALRRAGLAAPAFRDAFVAHPTAEVLVVYQLTTANERAWEPYRTFAERRVLAIRRGLQPLGYRNVRLVIAAPSSGTCLMVPYGEYRLIAGQGSWQQMSAHDVAQYRRRRDASEGLF